MRESSFWTQRDTTIGCIISMLRHGSARPVSQAAINVRATKRPHSDSKLVFDSQCVMSAGSTPTTISAASLQTVISRGARDWRNLKGPLRGHRLSNPLRLPCYRIAQQLYMDMKMLLSADTGLGLRAIRSPRILADEPQSFVSKGHHLVAYGIVRGVCSFCALRHVQRLVGLQVKQQKPSNYDEQELACHICFPPAAGIAHIARQSCLVNALETKIVSLNSLFPDLAVPET